MKVGTLLVSFFAVLMIGSSVYAQPHYTVFPGLMCKQIGTQSQVSYDQNGRIHNPSNRRVQIICPIIRDDPSNGYDTLAVVVADRSERNDISCKSFSAQTDGLGWSQSGKSEGTNPEWYQSQEIWIHGPTRAQLREGGSFYLLCTLPAVENGKMSGLLSYRFITVID